MLAAQLSLFPLLSAQKDGAQPDPSVTTRCSQVQEQHVLVLSIKSNQCHICSKQIVSPEIKYMDRNQLFI